MPNIEMNSVKGATLLAKLSELDPEGVYDVRIKTAAQASSENLYSLISAMRGMEDEPESEYTAQDLKEKWNL